MGHRELTALTHEVEAVRDGLLASGHAIKALLRELKRLRTLLRLHPDLLKQFGQGARRNRLGAGVLKEVVSPGIGVENLASRTAQAMRLHDDLALGPEGLAGVDAISRLQLGKGRLPTIPEALDGFIAWLRSEACAASKGKRPTEGTARRRKRAPRTELTQADRKRVTLAIVFTDIVESVALNHEVGDAKWHETRKRHFSRAEELIGASEGRLIKTTGDGLMAAFPTAVQAVEFALSLQADTGDSAIKIRAGVHVGPVTVADHDLAGQAVNIAQRVMSKGKSGGVWVSDRVKEDVGPDGLDQSLVWTKHPGCTLKGLKKRFTLWSVQRAPT